MSNPADEPKLIIDEDWKTQVQREKEQLKQQQAAEETSQTDSSSAAPSDSSQPRSTSTAEPPPPPASLSLLVTTLATQAMAALGLMPGEDESPPSVSLPYAKHFIDMLAVLEQKTAGNLSDEEKLYLQDALHQLRMAFVAVSKQVASS